MQLVMLLLVQGLFFVGLILERVFPARPLPRVKWWVPKSIAFLVVLPLFGILPAMLAPLVAPYAPIHLEQLPMPVEVLIWFLIGELVGYWTHRAVHKVPVLWRSIHQLHHSAERMDMAGSVMFHPNEVMLGGVFAAVFTGLLGPSVEAAAIVGMVSSFGAFFQHLNVRTPVWLGYIVQRPESHSVHHERGLHEYNYGTFPLSDLLFGTFRNPAKFSELAGFWDGASSKLGAMLLCRDVGTPPRATAAETSGARLLGQTGATGADVRTQLA